MSWSHSPLNIVRFRVAVAHTQPTSRPWSCFFIGPMPSRKGLDNVLWKYMALPHSLVVWCGTLQSTLLRAQRPCWQASDRRSDSNTTLSWPHSSPDIVWFKATHSPPTDFGFAFLLDLCPQEKVSIVCCKSPLYMVLPHSRRCGTLHAVNM